MTITVLLDGLPVRTMEQSVFDAAMAQMMSDLPTWASQANALAAAMGAFAAGGAMSIPYTFSTTTTDADPTSGFLRLSSATQNTSTVIRLDLVGADLSTWTSVIDTFDDSTSAVKGHILLQKQTDATKWLLFSVSALASPSGYKNITVANVASSAASPFANGDPLTLKFSRNGDKGDTGTAGSNGTNGILSGYVQTSDQTITSAGALTIAHGLSGTPKLFQAFLKNVTTQNGYSVGDITPVELGVIDSSSSRGVGVTADSTNIYVRFGSDSTVFNVANKTTGVNGVVTNANWSFFIRAWV